MCVCVHVCVCMCVCVCVCASIIGRQISRYTAVLIAITYVLFLFFQLHTHFSLFRELVEGRGVSNSVGRLTHSLTHPSLTQLLSDLLVDKHTTALPLSAS
eukprot:GHVU01058924.1.p1 GENE.GHVU01058924.1~~GHVU01058924.1.p1  ORF type:complete len:100 (-),score=3.67 GHVU01058924.1:152-451(-)